jgi:hypothetical protein
MDRLDVSRMLGLVAERLADDADGLAERGIGDGRVLPGGIEQLGLGHEAARTNNQAFEHAERAGRQRDLCLATIEDPLDAVEAEVAEPERGR